MTISGRSSGREQPARLAGNVWVLVTGTGGSTGGEAGIRIG
jgi:hypothetical protein